MAVKVLRATNFFVMGVVRNPNTGELISISEVESIRADVTKDGADAATWTNLTIPPSDVLFDEMVSDDPRWDQDSEGYNFRLMIPSIAIPDVGRYKVEVEFTPVSGPEIVGLWVVETLSRPNKV